MGIENRDYYREDSRQIYQPAGLADMPTACKRLLIATVVMFLVQIFFTRPATMPASSDVPAVDINIDINGDGVDEEMPAEYFEEMSPYRPRVSIAQEWLALDRNQVQRGQIWRVVTYAFCHNRFEVWHLIVNLLFLYWFGTRLEQMYGTREFTLFYFASAIVAGIAFLILDYQTGMGATTIGASGAVWGLVALYVIHHPYERINIYGLFPIEIRWLAVLYLVFDLHPILLAAGGDIWMQGGIARATHLGGAAFGFAYYYRSWRLAPLWNRITGSKHIARALPKKTPLTVNVDSRETGKRTDDRTDDRNAPTNPKIDPSTKRLEAELDDVLDKIQSQGRESLTDEEVQVLEQASSRLRNR